MKTNTEQARWQRTAWHSGDKLPSVDGLIVGCHDTATGMTALVDDADIHHSCYRC